VMQRGGMASALLLISSTHAYRHGVGGAPASQLRASFTARRLSVARIAMCSTEDKPMLGGRPVEDGDGLLVNDDESQAWWRASVVTTKGPQVLVHFTGCDPAWDEWIDVDSPKLTRMDPVEQKKDESAFQSDTIGDDIDDEELLAQYRQSRWDQNARWQLNVFAEEQLGSWTGNIERYEADGSGGVRPMDGSSAAWADCSCTTRISEDNTIEYVDSLPAAAAPLSVSSTLGLSSFRPELGSMAVASAFTINAPISESKLLFELAIREESRRVRCKLLYEPAVGSDDAPAMVLRMVGIVREVSAAVDGEASGEGNDEFFVGEGDMDGPRKSGRGLYDPPRGDKTGYISLYGEGGVTLVFPTTVAEDMPGCISLDWVAGNMRYQIDRKFAKLDGSLSSLELTEIRKSDADTRLPDFPHQSGGQ